MEKNVDMKQFKLLQLENEQLKQENDKLKKMVVELQCQSMGGSSSSLSDDDVTALCARMKKRSVSDQMNEEVQMCFPSSGTVSVTADQAYKIIKTFTNGGENQEKACIAIYPHLSDKHNFGKVLDACILNNSKTEVKKKLKL
jgi:hypothetical protein